MLCSLLAAITSIQPLGLCWHLNKASLLSPLSTSHIYRQLHYTVMYIWTCVLFLQFGFLNIEVPKHLRGVPKFFCFSGIRTSVYWCPTILCVSFRYEEDFSDLHLDKLQSLSLLNLTLFS